MDFIHVEDLSDSRLELFTKFNEAQLLHYYEPNGGVFICETPMVISRALDAGCEPIAFLVEKKAGDSAEFLELFKKVEGKAQVFTAELDVINKLTGFNLTRGVLCAMKRPELPLFSDLAKKSRRLAVLEDVVNPTNTGAIFRSAAALGVDGLLLTSDCADPLYRRAARVSMGTVFQLPWTYLPKDEDLCHTLHAEGFKTVCLALKDDALHIDDPVFKNQDRLAIILGTEAFGIKEETLSKTDFTAIIPMSNDVDSLNVAAASAVAFWELCK